VNFIQDHSWLGLLPDYDIGVSLAIGGPDNKDWVNDQIFEIVYPALEVVAREQADAAYTGTYTALSGLNSTITLTTEVDKPGLSIAQWLSNGMDVAAAFSQISEEPLTSRNFRLLPTNRERDLGDGTKEIARRAMRSTSYPTEKPGLLGACPAWFIVDGQAYGDFQIDEFLFTLMQMARRSKHVRRRGGWTW